MPDKGTQIRVNGRTYRILREESVRNQFEFNRQVSMGEIVAAALRVALAKPDSLQAEIAKGDPNV